MSEQQRTYPYLAWVLTPSFKPKEVEMAKQYLAFGGQDYGDLSEKGKLYPRANIFPGKREAVEEGWRRVDKQAADINKKMASLEKKRESLLKALREIGEAA